MAAEALWNGGAAYDDAKADDALDARFRALLASEVEALRGELGARFERGRFAEAVALFDRLSTAPEFEEFLTLPAYEQVLTLAGR